MSLSMRIMDDPGRLNFLVAKSRLKFFGFLKFKKTVVGSTRVVSGRPAGRSAGRPAGRPGGARVAIGAKKKII